MRARVSLGYVSSGRVAGLECVHIVNLRRWDQMLSPLPPAVTRVPHACQHMALSSCLFCHSKRCEVLSCLNGNFLITNKCEHFFICLLAFLISASCLNIAVVHLFFLLGLLSSSC